jgi:hypothetical protein
MSKIKAFGGDDTEEAIEIGLQHAHNEHLKQPVSAVILIADAPAKKLSVIKSYR